MEKKLKYLLYLEGFNDCPPSLFKEVDVNAYRWTRNPVSSNDFIPLNISSSPPPRMLDQSDKMCMGYGLSMFNTLENALDKYKKEFLKRRQHLRKQFIQDKGDFVAMLNLSKTDGQADEPKQDNFGHFTFHEYYHAELEKKVVHLYCIFTDNGEFNVQY